MMHVLRFLEKFFLFVAKLAKKNTKNANNEHIILHTQRPKPKILEMRKLAQTWPMV